MDTCQSLRGVTSSTISQRRRGADHGVISALAARMEGHVQGPRQIAVQDVAGRPEQRGHGEVAPARDEAYAADEDYCEGHGGGAVEPGEQLVPQNVLRVGTNGRVGDQTCNLRLPAPLVRREEAKHQRGIRHQAVVGHAEHFAIVENVRIVHW